MNFDILDRAQRDALVNGVWATVREFDLGRDIKLGDLSAIEYAYRQPDGTDKLLSVTDLTVNYMLSRLAERVDQKMQPGGNYDPLVASERMRGFFLDYHSASRDNPITNMGQTFANIAMNTLTKRIDDGINAYAKEHNLVIPTAPSISEGRG